MKLRRLLAPGLVALIALLGGCGGSSSKSTGSVALNATLPAVAGAPRTAVIAVARSSDSVSLDPQALTIGEDYTTQTGLYGGLVRITTNGKSIEGDLASSFTFDEARLTYTFDLRDGLKFSNGKPITTADIVYSIERDAKGEVYAPMFAAIRSVSAPNPHQIVIKLSRYSNLVLPILSYAFVVPRNLEGQTPVTFFKHPVSSGAFVLSSWKPGNRMVLERNPYYWDTERPHVNEIVFQIIPEENARLNALQAGDVQLDEYVPDEELPALPTDQLVKNEPRASLLVLMTNNGRAPFTSSIDREAVGFAINRPLLLKTVWGGVGVETSGFIPPGLPESLGVLRGSESWQYDPAKAKALLHGTNPPITLLTSYERGIDSTLVDVIQQELEQAGFHVTVEVRDYGTAVTQVLSGSFSIFLTPQTAYLPTVGEPLTTYDTLFTPAAHWDAKAVDGYLAAFSKATTVQQRKVAALAFERWAHANWVAIPIGNPDVFFGVSKRLRGLQVMPFGTYRLEDLQLAG
jgi:peptide/nickel transport system substrate-binding protein